MRRHNNHCIGSFVRGWLTALSVLAIACATMPAHAGETPIGTAFTYQGVLKHNGAPVNGSVALRFRMYTAEIGGTQVGPEIAIAGYTVEDGLLTVDLDFVNTSGFYDGSARWIEIDVAIEEETPFETLTPRQRITAAPAALSLPLPYVASATYGVGAALNITNTGWGAMFTGNSSGVLAQASPLHESWNSYGLAAHVTGGVGGGVIGGYGGSSYWLADNVGELGTDIYGVYGRSGVSGGIGIYGTGTTGIYGSGAYGVQGNGTTYGLFGQATSGGTGVYGTSSTIGVSGYGGASGGWGVYGSGTTGVYGYSGDAGGTAIYATAPNGKAIHAVNANTGHAGYFEGYCYFSNRVGFGVLTPSFPLHHSSGANLSFGGTWTNACDANLKENMRPVDSSDILTRVAELPIQFWNYKAEDGVNHIGPTAQDFHAAFGLGENDVTIGTVDADGVALAAIQALNAQLQKKDEQIAAIAEQNAAFEARLAQLEALIASQESNSEGEDQ